MSLKLVKCLLLNSSFHACIFKDWSGIFYENIEKKNFIFYKQNLLKQISYLTVYQTVSLGSHMEGFSDALSPFL